MEKLSGLRKLEILDVNFSDLLNFNSYTRTQHYQRLTHYRVQLNGREHLYIQFLQIYKCNYFTNLLDASPCLKMATDLKAYLISKCEGMEYLWCVEDCIASLNLLFLDLLPSLRVLFKFKPTDVACCSSLKHLSVSKCQSLKNLFTADLVKYHVRNLLLPFAKFAIPHRLDVGIASLFKPINMAPLPLL